MPPWLMGTAITVKADPHRLTCSCKAKAVATHPRCWQRTQRLAWPQHRAAARKHHHRHWYSQEGAACLALGDVAKTSLERLATTNHPLPKRVQRLLALQDDSGAHALIAAMQRASVHQAFGAHSIENILAQEMTPQRQPPPVRLKQHHLTHIRLEDPSLAEYDALVIKRQTP